MKTHARRRDSNSPPNLPRGSVLPTQSGMPWRWPANLIVSLLIVLAGGVAFILVRSSALATAPGLNISLSTNNGVLLTITNGESTEFYEIYSTNSLAEFTAWSLSITGDVGITNFYVPMGPVTMRFFKARAGNDWDGDGIKNFQDANPNDTNVGVLSVTIDTPANGATIN